MTNRGPAAGAGTVPDADIRLALARRQFNAGEYFACHETLERLWIEERTAVRDLYKGILQIAVALHHEGGGNRRGALRLLQSGQTLIEPFAPACQGLDVAGLLVQARACRAALDCADSEKVLSAACVIMLHAAP